MQEKNEFLGFWRENIGKIIIIQTKQYPVRKLTCRGLYWLC